MSYASCLAPSSKLLLTKRQTELYTSSKAPERVRVPDLTTSPFTAGVPE